MSTNDLVSLSDETYAERVRSILLSNRYLSGDNFQRYANEYPSAVYRKLEYVTRLGRWRGQIVWPGLLEILLPGRRTLIYGHSSASLSNATAETIRIAGRARLVGTNRIPDKDGSPIPLGLPNKFLDSPDHAVFGDVRLMLNSLEQKKPLHYLASLYANFDAGTHASRRHLADVLQRASTHLHHPDRSLSGRQSYLDSCRQANFVLCPRGVGEDTHRLWETIFLGSIPIVIRSPLMSFFEEHIPIMLVDSWEEILEADEMNRSYATLMSRQWNVNHLNVESWLPDL